MESSALRTNPQYRSFSSSPLAISIYDDRLTCVFLTFHSILSPIAISIPFDPLVRRRLVAVACPDLAVWIISSMGRSSPPFLYDPPSTWSFDGPTGSGFNPKAVTQASWTPRQPKPKPNGPLVNFNRHPDMVSCAFRSCFTMHLESETWIDD